MFRFIHAADVHLDSSLRGLERYEGAPLAAMEHATRRALQNLIDLALAEHVQLVLIAGDLYDGDWRDYSTGLFFTQQIARLHEAGITVLMIAGNHDAANRMTRTLRLPARVRMLSADEPESVELPDHGVVVHGQSFAQQAVSDDLSQRYPSARSGWFNIGLLHTCATGRDGHERYAPCTIDGLLTRGYDYWALGHIHKREILHAEPHIVFPGNTQGRTIRETGAKGCMLGTIDDAGQMSVEFRELDVFRWELCSVDASDCAKADDVVERVSRAIAPLRTDRPTAVRVEVGGATACHDELLADPARWTNEVRNLTLASGWDEVWIQRVDWRTHPESNHATFPDGPLAELTQLLEVYQHDPKRLVRRAQEWKDWPDLNRKLPAELLGAEAMKLDDPARLSRLLTQVQPLLMRLLRSRTKSS